MRDPRDVARSFVFHVCRTDHPLRPYFLSLPDDDARLLASIAGVTTDQTGLPDIFLRDIGARLDVIGAWSGEPDSMTLRFEELVGAQGGGDDRCQLRTVERIDAFLGRGLSASDMRNAAERAFDRSSATFREGQIGRWRKHFTPEHIATVKRVANGPLLRFGYETVPDWR